jgi:hypothetical protein
MSPTLDQRKLLEVTRTPLPRYTEMRQVPLRFAASYHPNQQFARWAAMSLRQAQRRKNAAVGDA